jgi:hypothetical protein
MYFQQDDSRSSRGGSAVVLYAHGTLGIEADAAAAMYLRESVLPKQVVARVKSAPVGADLEMTIHAGAQEWLSLTIAAGETSAESVGVLAALPADESLRLEITAVGTTFPGVDLAVFIYY